MRRARHAAVAVLRGSEPCALHERACLTILLVIYHIRNKIVETRCRSREHLHVEKQKNDLTRLETREFGVGTKLTLEPWLMFANPWSLLHPVRAKPSSPRDSVARAMTRETPQRPPKRMWVATWMRR